MGVGQALSMQITFQDRRAQQDNIDTYLIPRMGTAPRQINVHLVSSGGYNQPMVGVGDPGHRGGRRGGRGRQ